MFKFFLENGRFILRTDNRALIWFDQTKKGSGKLHRWSMYLRSFSFIIGHAPGRHNELPDAISRLPTGEVFVYDDPAETLLPPDLESFDKGEGKPYITRACMKHSVTEQDILQHVTPARLDNDLPASDWEYALKPGLRLETLGGLLSLTEAGCPPRICVTN